ncbi:hypothetical protein B0H34DRAFT_810715 [Crassisporium funariophilum]|nr:hypothetical protein B0H34DRAFT_810715 [Crassisporium funariophilum]
MSTLYFEHTRLLRSSTSTSVATSLESGLDVDASFVSTQGGIPCSSSSLGSEGEGSRLDDSGEALLLAGADGSMQGSGNGHLPTQKPSGPSLLRPTGELPQPSLNRLSRLSYREPTTFHESGLDMDISSFDAQLDVFFLWRYTQFFVFFGQRRYSCVPASDGRPPLGLLASVQSGSPEIDFWDLKPQYTIGKWR